MSRAAVILLASVATAAAVAAAICWPTGPADAPARGAGAGGTTDAVSQTAASALPGGEATSAPASTATREAAAGSRSDAARESARATMPAWPGRAVAAAPRASAATAGEPVVTKELAFAALQYVGVDAQAERTWLLAIHDARMPAGTRSDLIERLLPLEQDAVNAASFEEAYKDLLAMYVRLGGVR